MWYAHRRWYAHEVATTWLMDASPRAWLTATRHEAASHHSSRIWGLETYVSIKQTLSLDAEPAGDVSAVETTALEWASSHLAPRSAPVRRTVLIRWVCRRSCPGTVARGIDPAGAPPSEPSLNREPYISCAERESPPGMRTNKGSSLTNI